MNLEFSPAERGIVFSPHSEEGALVEPAKSDNTLLEFATIESDLNKFVVQVLKIIEGKEQFPEFNKFSNLLEDFVEMIDKHPDLPVEMKIELYGNLLNGILEELRSTGYRNQSGDLIALEDVIDFVHSLTARITPGWSHTPTGKSKIAADNAKRLGLILHRLAESKFDAGLQKPLRDIAIDVMRGYEQVFQGKPPEPQPQKLEVLEEKREVKVL